MVVRQTRPQQPEDVLLTGILRTGEMCGIVAGSLEPDGQQGTILLDLGLTKGAQRHGQVEHVVLDGKIAITLMLAAARGQAPGERIFNRSMPEC